MLPSCFCCVWCLSSPLSSFLTHPPVQKLRFWSFWRFQWNSSTSRSITDRLKQRLFDHVECFWWYFRVLASLCFRKFMILILIFLFYTSRRVSKRRYAVVLSKILPRFDVWILDAIKDDEYYCILLPMTIVPSILVLYLNWLGMKFYRHNWCVIYYYTVRRTCVASFFFLTSSFILQVWICEFYCIYLTIFYATQSTTNIYIHVHKKLAISYISPQSIETPKTKLCTWWL